MDGNSMGQLLELKLDRSSSYGSPGYEDFELSSVLTEAEMLYVKKFIDGKNNRKSESFEETEIRNQGLSALIKRISSLSVSTYQTGVLTNGIFYNLPKNFMYTINEDIVIDKEDCNNLPIEASVSVISHDEFSRLKNNKYKKPFFKSYGAALVWRLVYSRYNDGYVSGRTQKRHQLVTDGTFGITSYGMSYLIQPRGITVDNTTPSNMRNSILDDSTHNAIVDIATSLMLERVKEQELVTIESFKDLE